MSGRKIDTSPPPSPSSFRIPDRSFYTRVWALSTKAVIGRRDGIEVTSCVLPAVAPLPGGRLIDELTRAAKKEAL